MLMGKNSLSSVLEILISHPHYFFNKYRVNSLMNNYIFLQTGIILKLR